MFTLSLLLDVVTNMIFMEIESCYDSYHTVMIFSFIFSCSRTLLRQNMCFRIGVSFAIVLKADSELYLLRGQDAAMRHPNASLSGLYNDTVDAQMSLMRQMGTPHSSDSHVGSTVGHAGVSLCALREAQQEP